MKTIVSLLLILGSYAAQADQCQWNSASDATSARQLIGLHQEVMFYCQNCEENKPSFIAQVSDVKTRQATMSGEKYPYRTVVLTVDGQDREVDLAYLYVRTASNIFANVAQLVGCPSHGAVSFIETTNKNSKIQHYYNATGDRVDTATTTAQNTIPGKQRKPASPAKK